MRAIPRQYAVTAGGARKLLNSNRRPSGSRRSVPRSWIRDAVSREGELRRDERSALLPRIASICIAKRALEARPEIRLPRIGEWFPGLAKKRAHTISRDIGWIIDDTRREKRRRGDPSEVRIGLSVLVDVTTGRASVSNGPFDPTSWTQTNGRGTARWRLAHDGDAS